MKKISTVTLILSVFLFVAGCGTNNTSGPLSANPPSFSPSPTIGTGSGSNLFVLANFQLSGTQGIANCSLEDMSTSTGVNTATVTMNGNSVPYSGVSGVYSNLTLPGTYAAGDSITLSITSSFGTSTAVGTIPAPGSSANSVSVSNTYSGSVFNISN